MIGRRQTLGLAVSCAWLALAAVLVLGCTKTPEPAPAARVVATPSGDVGKARQAYSQRRYDDAKTAYEAVLERGSDSLRMEALYHLALIELVRDKKARNFGKARSQLGEVKVKSNYKPTEVEAILELLVNLEEARASLRRSSETVRQQQDQLEEQGATLRQKDEALKSVTDTIIGD